MCLVLTVYLSQTSIVALQCCPHILVFFLLLDSLALLHECLVVIDTLFRAFTRRARYLISSNDSHNSPSALCKYSISQLRWRCQGRPRALSRPVKWVVPRWLLKWNWAGRMGGPPYFESAQRPSNRNRPTYAVILLVRNDSSWCVVFQIELPI